MNRFTGNKTFGMPQSYEMAVFLDVGVWVGCNTLQNMLAYSYCSCVGGGDSDDDDAQLGEREREVGCVKMII